MKREVLKGHLDLIILATLESAPAHGYAILELLRQRSDGVFDLAEGTLYPALHRLERTKLLASSWVKHSGRNRRVYRITRTGRAALGTEEKQWSLFSAAMEAVLGTT